MVAVSRMALMRGQVQVLSSRLATPGVRHDEQDYIVMLTMIATLLTAALRAPVGSIAAWRDDITRGLDWLLWGI